MNWVNRIQEAINYIEERLLDEINVDDISQRIYYSPSFFQQIFTTVTGYSVAEYTRFRRLSLAADEIIENNAEITEMAFKYGYDTVEAFSYQVAFQRKRVRRTRID